MPWFKRAIFVIPWLWSGAGKDAFLNELIPEMNLPLRWEYLREGHPTVVAMNDVAARIDRHLRALDPGAMEAVPVPAIMVRDDDSVQAYAVAARVCFDIPMRLDDSVPRTATTTVAFVEVTRDDVIEPLRRQYANCHHVTSDAETRSFIKWFNAERVEQDACQLAIEGEGADREIVPGAGCGFDARIPGKFARARVTTVKANAPWIIAHTGIARVAQTPDQVAFVIAHELAHYYRAHYARSLKRYTVQGHSHEEEADDLATRWIAAIGFDPRAGIAFFENYMRLYPESAVGETGTAHPGPRTRVENIARVIEDLL